ncbi:MAG: FeoC-like transcriptional regulator [Chloroflexi bacterium]|nr:FeoC-like transcriptional regulator [Chloroflexota bacterium]
MLEQLLNEIHAGGSLETNALAVRLSVSPLMIQAMLEHLERMGMIRPYSTCSDGCKGCSLQTSCHGDQPGKQVRLWQSVDMPGIAQVQ